MNLFGLGIAIAALVFGYTVPENPAPWDAGLLLVFTFAAAVFCVAGALAKVPTAEVDERWDDRYDALRDLTEEVHPPLSGAFIGAVWTRGLTTGEPCRESWGDYIKDLPIPIPDSRPLHEWAYFLESHESNDVRQFFRFARAADTLIPVGNFRRYAVRTYHRFGRLIRADASGFQAWFGDEGVKDGAEPLVVLLAYLEIARAVRFPTEFRGDGHSGFWYLAQRWHPNTMRLPRPTPSATSGASGGDKTG